MNCSAAGLQPLGRLRDLTWSSGQWFWGEQAGVRCEADHVETVALQKTRICQPVLQIRSFL